MATDTVYANTIVFDPLMCPYCGATAGTPEWIEGADCRVLTARCALCLKSFPVDIEEKPC